MGPFRLRLRGTSGKVQIVPSEDWQTLLKLAGSADFADCEGISAGGGLDCLACSMLL